MRLHCDLFCNIIDNYGDIGVCWRLARQLYHDHGASVRLWVNDLETFSHLAPRLDPKSAQQALDGITVCHWQGEIDPAEPGDLVIEGFGCTLPTGFLRAMAARPSPPVWLNLEYLSAEPWVEDCHGLPSVHPATGMKQHFWFPGFSPRTGGLLRESGLVEARSRFQADAEAQKAFWSRIGVPEAMSAARRISLFSYENPAIPGLTQALAEESQASLLAVPVGRAMGDVCRWAGISALQAGDRLVRGSLTIAVLPLLAPEDYDRLLWACELNAIRGEDSFVRAQWASRPLLWHIYPQEEDAHWVKLESYMTAVQRHSPMPALWAEAMRAWNRSDPGALAWPALLADLPVLQHAAEVWGKYLTDQTDLASGVMHFYQTQVQ